MRRPSEIFSEEQRRLVEQAVADAESKTCCEIVPVVAAASGRYDRAEDIVGMWFAGGIAILIWLFVPRPLQESGSWGGASLLVGLTTMILGFVVAFILGTVVASRIGWLRRLFTPAKQMRNEVAARARQVFFDKRVHHTQSATGLLIYISLFERRAMLLGDEGVLKNVGQVFFEQRCEQLNKGLRQGDLTKTICEVISTAGNQLAVSMPQQGQVLNELSNPLVLIDFIP